MKTLVIGSSRKHTIQDLTGLVFGELTVMSRNETEQRQKRTYWWCRCSCGKTLSVKGEYLRAGRSKSCGCMRKHSDPKQTYIVEPGVRVANMIGRESGELVVVAFSRKNGKHSFWQCLCSCGESSVVRSDNIIEKSTRSCGCVHRGNTNATILVAPGKRAKDFTGHKFGELTAISFSHTSPAGADVWLCQCSCGSQALVESRRMNRIHSCGCLRGYLYKNTYDWHVIADGVKIRLRSSYEVVFAEYLVRHAIPFEYEPQRFELRPDLTYVPDFYLPSEKAWVEVKGYLNPRSALRVELFRKVPGNQLVLVDKNSLANYLPAGLSYWRWLRLNRPRFAK